VALLRRCHHELTFYARLQAQCAARAPLFAPETERLALQQLVRGLTAVRSRF
jgi:hypothetical protein